MQSARVLASWESNKLVGIPWECHVLCPPAASCGKVCWRGCGKSQGPGIKKMLFWSACEIEQNPAKALGEAGLDLMVCPDSRAAPCAADPSGMGSFTITAQFTFSLLTAEEAHSSLNFSMWHHRKLKSLQWQAILRWLISEINYNTGKRKKKKVGNLKLS